jgi:hypothetical protein
MDEEEARACYIKRGGLRPTKNEDEDEDGDEDDDKDDDEDEEAEPISDPCLRCSLGIRR